MKDVFVRGDFAKKKRKTEEGKRSKKAENDEKNKDVIVRIDKDKNDMINGRLVSHIEFNEKTHEGKK